MVRKGYKGERYESTMQSKRAIQMSNDGDLHVVEGAIMMRWSKLRSPYSINRCVSSLGPLNVSSNPRATATNSDQISLTLVIRTKPG